MELPRALFTRASLTFQTGTKRPFAVLISILHPGSVGRALKRLAPGTLPKRVLQSIHLIRPRDLNHAWSSDTSSFSLQTAPTDSSSVIKFFTLNVQHIITNKLAPLRHFIEFHEFPELLCLQEIGTTSATFRFHPLYEPFFTVGVRKCLGVAILIRRVASFSYVKSEIRFDGRGVAVWFSMYGTPFLAVGLYLHASGQYEDYEPLLSWAQALVISTPDTWCIVLGDLNRNPGWVMGFPHAPPHLSDLFDQFVLDASLTRADFTCVFPTWIGSQGWSNVLDYILVCTPPPPRPSFTPRLLSLLITPLSLSPCPYESQSRNRNYGKRNGVTIFLKRSLPFCVNASTHASLSRSHPARRIMPPPTFFVSYSEVSCLPRKQFSDLQEVPTPRPVWLLRNNATSATSL